MVRISVGLVTHTIGHPETVSECLCMTDIQAAYLVLFFFSADMTDMTFRV